MRVAIFTDNDFDKTNGVTTTLRAVLRHAPPDLALRIYTMSDAGCDQTGYLALRSFGMPIPFYNEMRMYMPRVGEFRHHLAADHAAAIHITTPGPAGLAARYLVSRLRLPAVGSFHTQLAEYTQLLSGSRALARGMNHYMRWLYGGCERLLVPSDATRQRLADAGWSTGNMAVWPRGVDTFSFSPARRSEPLRGEWHVSDKRPAVLYAGRVSREKGLALLDSIDSFLYRRGVHYRLIVAGDGPMTAELRDRCPDAVFLGHVRHEDMGQIMASADVFLFPSDTDTAGNVVLEAQACGLPVLVSNLGGPREQMLDGQTGHVCASMQVERFAERAATLLTARDVRMTMSAAARAYAMTRTWQAALTPLFAAYRGMLAARAATATLRPVNPQAGLSTP